MSLLLLFQNNLKPTDTLAATPVGVGVLAGTLTDTVHLSAAPTGVGNTAGALTILHNLSTSPIGVGSLGGALTEKHLLAAAAIGVGLLGGTLGSASLPPIIAPPVQHSAAHNTYIGSSGGFIAPELWRNFLRRTFGIRNFWRYDQAMMLWVSGEITDEEFVAMVSSIREYLAS